jgi:hypothetical protein
MKGHVLRVFENMLWGRLYGAKRKDVTGGCKQLHNKEFNNLYSSYEIIMNVNTKEMREEGHVARM